jgi:hypothetical protein
MHQNRPQIPKNIHKLNQRIADENPVRARIAVLMSCS